jgi:hypothetical protein
MYEVSTMKLPDFEDGFENREIIFCLVVRGILLAARFQILA